MKSYNKFFSAGFVLLSALVVSSCSQGPDSKISTASTSADAPTTTDTGTKITGSYVAMSADSVSAYSGETFTLDVTANDFATSEGGSLSISYDSAVVQVTTVNVDTETWEFVNRNGQVNNAEGSVSNIVFSSHRGVSGDAKIATVEFKAVAAGETEIQLRESSVNPFASNGEKMAVSFKSANVSVN